MDSCKQRFEWNIKYVSIPSCFELTLQRYCELIKMITTANDYLTTNKTHSYNI